MADANPLVLGDPPQLGVYRLEGRLGEGGQGVVYLGRHPDGREVAVKLLRAQFSNDEEARSRFIRELEVIGRIAGFCTAQVLDSDMAGNQPYIVSEYVRGPALQDLVEQQGPRTGTDLERLAVGTATALTAIHRAGVVHRDFKPPNVLMGVDGPRVIDFGIARALDNGATVASGVVGTPAYMAPEQLTGEWVDTPVDIFAWGATITFAATGRKPFNGETVPRVIHQVLHEPPSLDGVPPQLRKLLEACMAKEAAARPSAQEVLLFLLGGAAGNSGHPTGGNQGQLLNEGAAAAQPGSPATPPGGLTTMQPPGYAPPTYQQPQQYGRQPYGGPPVGNGQMLASTPPTGGPKKRPLPAIMAAVAAVVLLGGGAAFWALSGGSPNKPNSTPGSMTPSSSVGGGIQPVAPPPEAVTAMATATRSLPVILGYSYQSLDGSQQAADALLTPAFRNTWDSAFNASRARYAKDQQVMQTTVRNAGVVGVGPGGTVILADLDRAKTIKGKPNQYRDALLVTMRQADGKWLVDNLSAPLDKNSRPYSLQSMTWPTTGALSVLKAAEDCWTSTQTYNYQQLSQLAQNVHGCGTGPFVRDFDSGQQDMTTKLTAEKANDTAVVVQSAIQDVPQGDQVTVLITFSRTNTDIPRQSDIFQTEQIKMQYVNGKWLLEDAK